MNKRKYWLLAADLAIIPGLLLCKLLSGLMLSYTSECPWATLGGQCVTCGGTHFVNALSSGQIGAAFTYNPFLFLLTVFLVLSLVLLNLHWVFEVKFAKTVLTKVYTYPTLLIGLGLMLLFFIARNMPVFIHVGQILFS